MDPVTIALATAVAGGVGGPLGQALAEGGTDLLKTLRKKLFQRFSRQPEAQSALAAAQVDPEDTEAVEVLAGHIVAAEEADPEIGGLATQVRRYFANQGDVVQNTVHGDVTGSVVQGRDFHGDMHFGR